MAFVNVYVLSPFTGKNLGRDCYCSCCWNCTTCSGSCVHKSGFSSLGFCCPIDIGGAGYIQASTQVKFYGNSYIGSIRTERRSGFCGTSPGSPWDDAVIVKLYRYPNGVCYIGQFFYGHLANRISNGLYNNPNGLIIGTVPACCPSSCYFGVHVHMGRDAYAATRNLACDSVFYAGSSWVFKWTWNDLECP